MPVGIAYVVVLAAVVVVVVAVGDEMGVVVVVVVVAGCINEAELGEMCAVLTPKLFVVL